MAERTFRTAPPITPAGRWGSPRRRDVGDAALMPTARCRRHSSVRAAPPPGPTSRRERRLVGVPSPTDEPAAPISEATPAGPPVAPRMVGYESSGPETGRGDQDEIHHLVIDDAVGQDGPPGGRRRLPSTSRIHGDHLSLL